MIRIGVDIGGTKMEIAALEFELVKRYTPLAGLIHVSRARSVSAPSRLNSTQV